MKKIFSEFSLVQAVLLASLVMLGGFIEVFAFIISAVLAILLIIAVIRNKSFRFRRSIVSVAVLCIPLFYLITVFYAVDTGMAILGFLKYASVGLFALLVMQYDGASQKTINMLPWFALFLGAASAILMLIPGLPFTVNGRMAGFFEYPNTFAMLLLIGELAALTNDKPKLGTSAICAALMLLILLTGSRTVLVLTVVSNIAMMFTKKNKRIKIITGIAVGALAATAGALYLLRGDNAFLNRLFAFSATESTFVGRLLYYSDSLKLIVTHPFGLGYMGYSYLEPGIQTGVYSVKNVHNGLLQLMLDIGWIPAVLFTAALIWSLFSKRLSSGRKIILMTFFVHTLFDFDLSFPAMFFIMILLMDIESGKESKLAKNTVLLVGALGMIELFFAVHAGLWYMNACAAADALYPYNTENKTVLMLSHNDIDEQYEEAEKILKNNKNVIAAYSVKSAYAYSKGDIANFVLYKNQLFDMAPFLYDEYEDYAYKLIAAIDVYAESDKTKASLCANELLKTKERLESLDDRLSPLGRIIKDQPITKLPDEIEDYIVQLP